MPETVPDPPQQKILKETSSREHALDNVLKNLKNRLPVKFTDKMLLHISEIAIKHGVRPVHNVIELNEKILDENWFLIANFTNKQISYKPFGGTGEWLLMRNETAIHFNGWYCAGIDKGGNGYWNAGRGALQDDLMAVLREAAHGARQDEVSKDDNDSAGSV